MALLVGYWIPACAGMSGASMLAFPQRGFERRAPRRIDKIAIIVGGRLGPFPRQRCEDRGVLLENVSRLLLEIGEFGKLMHVRIARRARHGGKLDPGVRDGMRAVRFVGSVLHDEMDEV